MVLVVGCWWLVVRCWLLAVYLLLCVVVAGLSEFVVYSLRLFGVRCLWSVVGFA